MYRREEDKFFNKQILNVCPTIKYVDLFQIKPGKLKESVWISFVGDSVIRDIFHASVQRFVGYSPKDEAEVINTIMGKHLGPLDEAHVNRNFSDTYHQEHLVCCRVEHTHLGKGNQEGVDSCIFAIHKNAAQGNPESSRKNRFYLYSDIPTYIMDFVMPLYIDEFKCLSFHWSPRFIDAKSKIHDLHSKVDIHPSAIFFNMGLHESMNNQNKEHLRWLVTETNTLRETYGTRFLYHLPTYVNEKAENWEGKVSINGLNDVNKMLETQVLNWPAVDGRFLYLRNYTKTLSGFKCQQSDGIHFSPRCNYQSIVTQWDFNWLLKMGVIQTKD